MRLTVEGEKKSVDLTNVKEAELTGFSVWKDTLWVGEEPFTELEGAIQVAISTRDLDTWIWSSEKAQLEYQFRNHLDMN